jgi:hypothetical protein
LSVLWLGIPSHWSQLEKKESCRDHLPVDHCKKNSPVCVKYYSGVNCWLRQPWCIDLLCFKNLKFSTLKDWELGQWLRCKYNPCDWCWSLLVGVALMAILECWWLMAKVEKKSERENREVGIAWILAFSNWNLTGTI